MRTVVFVINSLGSGGAERVLVNLLTALGEERRHRLDVQVVLLDTQPEYRDLPAWVTKHVLDSRLSLARSLRQLYSLLRRLEPDLVVSFLVRANLASALVCRVLGIPCIVNERMHLTSHLEGKYGGLKLLATKTLPRLSYRLATRVIGVSEGVTEDMIASFGADPSRTLTIINSFDLDTIWARAKDEPEVDLPSHFFVAVGRLEPSKAMDVLIDAYIASGIEAELVILGEGSCRDALQRQVQGHGAAHRIHLLGYARNPFAVVARAKACLSASTNEGFPNAMVEAMALGLPVIATDCRSGPSEILAGKPRENRPGIRHAEYGILVHEGDRASLATAMRQLSDDPAQAEHYSRQARVRAADFAVETIAERMWSVVEAEAHGRAVRRTKQCAGEQFHPS